MSPKKLMYGGIIAALIIAAAIGIGIVNGVQGTKSYVVVNPVSDLNRGDSLTISGTTNLPAGTALMVEVTPASFELSVPDAGEFSGALGGVDVIAGAGGINTWSMDVDTSQLLPAEYLVNASVYAGQMPDGNFSTTGPFGRTRFTVHKGPANPAPTEAPGKAVAGGILIDPIRDTARGSPLEVTGTTSLPAGTDLLVRISAVSVQGGKIAADPENLENVAITRVGNGNGNNNRFSVSFDTRSLAPSDYIMTVSDVQGSPAGVSSVPGSVNGSLIFNIIEGTAGTLRPGTGTSVPAIFINPVRDVTAGETVVITGTTSVPAGSALKVSVIPESPDAALLQKNSASPEFMTTVSVARGSARASLFAAAIPTKGLAQGEHILTVSAERYDVTGSVLLTVK